MHVWCAWWARLVQDLKTCHVSNLRGLPLPGLLELPFELLSQLLQIETNWAAGSNTRTNYILATYRLLLKLYQGFGL